MTSDIKNSFAAKIKMIRNFSSHSRDTSCQSKVISASAKISSFFLSRNLTVICFLIFINKKIKKRKPVFTDLK